MLYVLINMYLFRRYVSHPSLFLKILFTDGTKLVVVGDQSSGKSSVLEGLTKIPFPRDSGLCTRFPTQIVFKRSKMSTTEVSILAAHNQAKSTVDAIAKFGKRQVTSLDEHSFLDLLALVTKSTPSHLLSLINSGVVGIRMYGTSVGRDETQS
jgi:GTPase SAR1 family protein